MQPNSPIVDDNIARADLKFRDERTAGALVTVRAINLSPTRGIDRQRTVDSRTAKPPWPPVRQRMSRRIVGASRRHSVPGKFPSAWLQTGCLGALEQFVGRHVLLVRGNQPLVAYQILDTSTTVAVELIGGFHERGGACL